MRIFTRYILKEVLSHAFLGLMLFTFVLLMPNLPYLMELIVRNSTSLGSVAEVFLLILPNMFTVTIPMAVLVGILLGLSRLAADSEITAMRASGVGVWRFVGIVALVGIAAWGVDLVNTTYLAPKATLAMQRLESNLLNAQASYEVQPRVFNEEFKHYVFYVQDVRASMRSTNWREIFLADLSDPTAPKITTGASATVVTHKGQGAVMRLRDGTEHQMSATNPGKYDISTFAQMDLPLTITAQSDGRVVRSDTPMLAMTNRQLLAHGRKPHGRLYAIELQRRFAFPAACLVLMLVAVPLGISFKRGGKGAGFVLTVVLVFLYYFLSSTGTALARQSKIPVVVGVWAVNVLFAIGGVLLLRQMSKGGAALAAIASVGGWFKRSGKEEQVAARGTASSVKTRHARGRFPLIFDQYVLKQFLSVFAQVLITFVMLMLLFTFFELLGAIIRNHASLLLVGDYLVNLTPSMIYTITPLSVLIAVLVVFGMLSRSSELTAIKSAGVSLYRIVLPMLVIASILAMSLFLFDQFYLPQANRRQQALRNIIKGKPAQTVEHPGENWIFGIQKPGEPEHMFYYQFFDAAHDTFANISVFEFAPGTFSISKRIFATSAHWEPQLNQWVFEDGWVRTFKGAEISSFQPFVVNAFPEIHEHPHYFKTEGLPSSEMNFNELSAYIHELQQSGFDTIRLRVQLNRKLAYPLITLVMAILAIPFAVSMGRRGSLAGIAIAIGVAIAYFIVAGTFEAMGNVNMLPAMLAAWSPDVVFVLIGGYLLLRTPT
ncbi:MAG TPA: LptF/LptG family permease [Acidobacteriaceae bacterium]|nr:LptF/LptG family permease [Acidobacteriaceae bacterium]